MSARYQRIKEAVSAAQVACDHGLETRPDGSGREKALCPFHDDTRPSLKLFQDGGYKCFSCDAVGDAVDLEQKLGGHQNASDAARELEERYGLRDTLGNSRGAPKAAGGNPGEVCYDYRDEGGETLYRVKRTSQKAFYPFVPDGAGGFKTGRGVMKGVRQVLYRLPELEAADEGETVYICEGEKDADVGAAAGLLTVAHQGGSNRWRKEYADFLEDRHVRILPDNDVPGRKWALRAHDDLRGVANSVEIVSLPVEMEGGDLADYLGCGGTVEELERLPATDPDELRELVKPEEHQENPEPNTDENQKPTQAEILIDCASTADLFHTPGGDVYASVLIDGHRETYPIKSKGFKRWLLRGFYERTGRPPGAQAMQDALGLLEAKAEFDGPTRDVSVRVAEYGGNIYIDLTNERWEVVEVTPDGWRTVSGKDAPVRFRRPRGMLPLPAPVSTGENADGLLRRFLNIAADEDLRLIIAWLIAALRPTGPYPVLLLQGEQGSAKSTAERLIRALVDPSAAPLRTTPRSEHDLFVAADNAHVIALDNISTLQPWCSDALCRLSTGGGFSTRMLYEGREEELFDGIRPIILNGITDVASRPDLLDRSLIVSLPPIPDEDRKAEKELWRDFEDSRPALLGALLDGVSGGLRTVEDVRLGGFPRMADFAVWVTAAESALGLPEGSFMSAYTGNREAATDTALDADPVADTVLKLMEEREEWIGTATELWSALGDLADEDVRRTKAWPGAPNALTGRLKRLAPTLRGVGVSHDEIRVGKSGRKQKRLTKNMAAKDRQNRQNRQPGENAQYLSLVEADGSADDGLEADGPSSQDRQPEFPTGMGNTGVTDDEIDADDDLRPHSRSVEEGLAPSGEEELTGRALAKERVAERRRRRAEERGERT